MLAKPLRLPAYTRLSHPITIRTEDFILKYTNNNLEYSRFGFIVRKKTDKRAVVRNRMRRVLRSCIEELFPTIVPGKDMLFLLEKSIIDKQRQEILQELTELFTKRQFLR